MIYIIILGLIAGYREVQILCDRGSWSYMNFRNWFWFTNQADKKESWKDSFHVSNGIYALVLCISLVTCTKIDIIWVNQLQGIWYILALILILWVIYMWARNIMMHIILPYKPIWKYLSPIHL